MRSDARALASDGIVFAVATVAVRLLAPDRGGEGTMVVGGLTGGAVALGVWLTERRTAARRDGGAA